MILFKHAADLRSHLSKKKIREDITGYVPTLGALHQGHISLIKMSKEQCNTTICSIFINPTQFTDQKDFENYPVSLADDIRLLEMAGCDILFLPQANEIYPDGLHNLPLYNLGEIEHVLEGKYRPGHFQGVCQVVDRLLNIINPDNLFLGQKDYQQCLVIRQLLKLTASHVNIKIGNTYREASGLAMSSRNQRLSEDQKVQASAIYKMLVHIKNNYYSTPLNELINYASDFLLANGFSKVDYIMVADAETLHPVSKYESQNVVALIAAFIGHVRLIDNMPLF